MRRPEVRTRTDCKYDYLLKPSAGCIHPSFAVLNEVTTFKLGGGSSNYFVTFVKSRAEEAGSGENGTDHRVTSIDCYNSYASRVGESVFTHHRHISNLQS